MQKNVESSGISLPSDVLIGTRDISSRRNSTTRPTFAPSVRFSLFGFVSRCERGRRRNERKSLTRDGNTAELFFSLAIPLNRPYSGMTNVIAQIHREEIHSLPFKFATSALRKAFNYSLSSSRFLREQRSPPLSHPAGTIETLHLLRVELSCHAR